MAETGPETIGRGAAVVDLEERHWLPRYCEGDEEAFRRLVHAYRRPIYAFLVRCGVRDPARDDLFQEFALRVHRAAASYDQRRPLRAWLFAIAANLVRSHFQQHARRAAREGEGPPVDPTDPAPGADAVAEARETLAWLERAIPRLPLAQREVIALCCIEQMAHQDVAAALQIPVNTVKTHLRRARLRLAAELAAHRRGRTP